MVILRALWICVILGLSGQVIASISSQVDRNTLEQGESLLLVLNMQQQDNQSIDLSPLEQDFEILGRSHKTTTSIINGNIQTQTRLILTLAPKRAGTLTVPPLTLEGAQTEPHEIVVTPLQMKSAVDGGVELLSRLSDEAPRVQQPIIYQLSLVLGQRIANAVFQEPRITEGSATVEPLGEQRQHRQEINGNEVLVVEQAWLITPQQSGRLEIESAKLGADILSSSNPYARFTDPRALKRIHLAADSYSLDVKPIPAGFSGKQWLAAQSLTLKDELQTGQLRAGEPVTRTLILEAVGIGREQLSELELPDIAGVKQYAAKPTFQTQQQGAEISVRMTQEITLIPTRSGTLTLPQVELPWWNTTADQEQIARLPARQLEVMPGVNQPETVADTPPAPSQPVVAAITQPAPDAVTEPEQPVSPGQSDSLTHWAVSVLALLLGITTGVLVTLFWLRHRRVKTAEASQIAPVVSTGQAGVMWCRFEQACKNHEPHAARSALLQWLQQSRPGFIHLNQLYAQASPELKQTIDELNRSCFGDIDLVWQGDRLLAQVREQLKSRQTEATEKPGLTPLVPA